MAQRTVMTVEVSRGTYHDGPGLRTTVFTKGCTLDCRWCQNPESINANQEIWYEQGQCIGCLECIKTCRSGALEASAEGIKIDRIKCTGCAGCTGICPAKALTAAGTIWTLDRLVKEVMRDKIYYDESGGGVTVSGGEPLIHADFLVDFFKELKANGVHTALDTCGCVPWETILKILPYTDMVLYDIKLMDPVTHKILTGRDNQLIFGNIKLLADYICGSNIKLRIRTPVIPKDTGTEENITQIADFIAANILNNIECWELCAFNPLCAVKYIKMQKPWFYKGTAAIKQIDAESMIKSALSRGIPRNKVSVTGLIKA
ncbi:MAG: glycyl-radical enzyme activating protein [Oscillospiraceae bacterium]|nr:glycyl-radical enzyme activating protein [Oscillospiraceae bacterium]